MEICILIRLHVCSVLYISVRDTYTEIKVKNKYGNYNVKFVKQQQNTCALFFLFYTRFTCSTRYYRY